MKIKFQQGGALPPFLTYLPVAVTPLLAATPLATEQPKDTVDLTDKDIIKRIADFKGLPSDLNTIIHSLLYFKIAQSLTPNSKDMPTADIAVQYLMLLQKLKVAEFNKAEYDSAYKKVNENGGINEFAINERGQLFCFNPENRDYELLTLEELNNHPEYKPLTNSDLLTMRARDNDLAYNNDILRVVENGIGIEGVTKYINDIVSKMGTTTKELDSFLAALTKLGLENLNLANLLAENNGQYNLGLRELYKYKYLTKSLTQQAQLALKSIYRALPKNAHTLLRTRTQNGTPEEAILLIADLIGLLQSSTENLTIDLFNESGNKRGSGRRGGSEKDDTELKTSLPLNVMKGIGGVDMPISIDIGNGIGMSVYGQFYPQIKSTKDEPILDTSLQNMLALSGLQSITSNTRNITFGDLKIGPELLSNITYNNTGVTRAILPKNEDGSVRIDLLEDYEKAKNEIDLLGNRANVEDIKSIFEKYDLLDLILPSGQLNLDKFGAFMITEGYTTEKNGITDSEYVKHIKLPTDETVDLIKRSLTVGTGDNAIVPDIDADSNWPGDWWGMYDDIFKAAVYIPINNNVNAAVYGAGLHIDYDEATILEAKYLDFDKLKTMQTTSAEVL